MNLTLDKESWMPYMETMRTMSHLFKNNNGDELMHDPGWYLVKEGGDIELLTLEQIVPYISIYNLQDIAYGLAAQLKRLETILDEKRTTTPQITITLPEKE